MEKLSWCFQNFGDVLVFRLAKTGTIIQCSQSWNHFAYKVLGEAPRLYDKIDGRAKGVLNANPTEIQLEDEGSVLEELVGWDRSMHGKWLILENKAWSICFYLMEFGFLYIKPNGSALLVNRGSAMEIHAEMATSMLAENKKLGDREFREEFEQLVSSTHHSDQHLYYILHLPGIPLSNMKHRMYTSDLEHPKYYSPVPTHRNATSRAKHLMLVSQHTPRRRISPH
jgi:hypothetical protein